MQILRTRGIAYPTWGGYLTCRVYTQYLPTLVFRYLPKTADTFLAYTVRDTTPIPELFIDMPIGMSADACLQYWNDL